MLMYNLHDDVDDEAELTKYVHPDETLMSHILERDPTLRVPSRPVPSRADRHSSLRWTKPG